MQFSEQDVMDVLMYRTSQADGAPFDNTADNRASYARGEKLAAEAVFVKSRRWMNGAAPEPAPLGLDSPLLIVNAGYIANNEAVRYAGLRVRVVRQSKATGRTCPNCGGASIQLTGVPSASGADFWDNAKCENCGYPDLD